MRSRSCYVIEITVIPWLDAYVNIFQIVFPFLIIRQNAWHFMERNELFVAEFESIYELFIPNSPHRICMSIVSVSIASFLVAQFNFHPPPSSFSSFVCDVTQKFRIVRWLGTFPSTLFSIGHSCRFRFTQSTMIWMAMKIITWKKNNRRAWLGELVNEVKRGEGSSYKCLLNNNNSSNRFTFPEVFFFASHHIFQNTKCSHGPFYFIFFWLSCCLF